MTGSAFAKRVRKRIRFYALCEVKKKLLLDLKELGILLDNLEGMTLGSRLPDGTQSLLLVSDNNFNSEQVTQFLLFRLS